MLSPLTDVQLHFYLIFKRVININSKKMAYDGRLKAKKDSNKIRYPIKKDGQIVIPFNLQLFSSSFDDI